MPHLSVSESSYLKDTENPSGLFFGQVLLKQNVQVIHHIHFKACFPLPSYCVTKSTIKFRMNMGKLVRKVLL